MYDYDGESSQRPKKSQLFVCEMGCGRTFTLRKNMKRHIKNRSCRLNYGYGYSTKSNDVVLRNGKYVFTNMIKIRKD